MVFFVENQDLSITLDKDEASHVQVAGGTVNTAYYDYLGAAVRFAEQKELLQERIRETNEYQDNLLSREITKEAHAKDNMRTN